MLVISVKIQALKEKMRQLMVNDNMENMPPALPRGQVTEGLPCLSGRVTMIREMGGKTQKVRVVLKVYDSFDSYVVLSQDKVVGKDVGCFSLKNFTYKTVPSTSKLLLNREHKFQIAPRNCEGTVMTFATSSKQETARWVEDLTRLAGPVEPVVPLRNILRPVSPRSAGGAATTNKRSSLLPSLEEEENNEE